MNRKGSFKKGHTPWNKGVKGLHLSPETEFKKGENSGNRSHSWKGGVQKPHNDCTYLNTGINTRVRRPKLIWESFHGKVPDGYVIHHIDEDNGNDEISNLEAISRAELLKINKIGFREIHQEKEDPEDKYWRDVATYNERHSVTDDDLW